MGQWKIINKFQDLPTDAVMNVASLGLYGLLGRKTYVYTIEHIETGERKTVKAENDYDLGDIISSGDFEDE